MPILRSRAAARARLNEALAKHLIEDFTEHGAEVIGKLRRDKPADYLRMVTTAFQNDEPVSVGRGLAAKIIDQVDAHIHHILTTGRLNQAAQDHAERIARLPEARRRFL